jgi:drug/metabolite transporter (DMT)-like permease
MIFNLDPERFGFEHAEICGADMPATRFSILCLLSGAVLISFSGVWVKISHVAPPVSAFYRVFFGGIILLAIAAYRREIKWRGTGVLFVTIVCGAFFSLDLLLYHKSIQYIGPGLGTILPNFQVFILSGIGVVFLKEKPGIKFLLSIPLAMTGLFLIVGIDWQAMDPLYKIGVYLGLSAAVAYAAFLMSLRKLQSDQAETSKFYVLMIVSLTTAGFLAVEVMRTGNSFGIPGMQSFLSLAALGLLSQVIGWMLITNALPHIRASLSGLILLLQPALAFVWDVLFFNRPTTPANWVGVGIALAAIYMGTVQSSKSG